MPETKGSLKPAIIENLTTHEVVFCMFNPHEYTLTKQNQWEAGEAKGLNVPKIKFRQGGAESLRLQLFFDTYSEGTDVRLHTAPLWKMMMVSAEMKNPKSNKSEPPRVAFHWGNLYFRAVIMDIAQRFTLFDRDGLPLRTTVNVTFQQVEDSEEFAAQNPTSGSGPAQRTHVVQAGDRLDLIAYRAYKDATRWRLIADANGLQNPLRLRDGQPLIIPPLE
ncbi:MAG: CIS tube protein [Anaerolineae bacterium]